MLGSHADLEEVRVADDNGKSVWLSEVAYTHCKLFNIPHMLVSSLDGTNMDMLLQWLGQTALGRRPDQLGASKEMGSSGSDSAAWIQLETDEGYMEHQDGVPYLDDSCC